MIEVYAKNSREGWVGVASEEQWVFATASADTQQQAIHCLLSSLPFNVPFEATSTGSPFSEKTLALIENIYDGKDVTLKQVCFATEHLPVYTQKVLQTVSSIPVGYVASYSAVAKAAGGGARAVGNVMAANPFAPVVPCHRVVSADFTLGGYSGGLNVKTELLKRERRGHAGKLEIPVDGGKLVVFPVEFVLRKLNAKFRVAHN